LVVVRSAIVDVESEHACALSITKMAPVPEERTVRVRKVGVIAVPARASFPRC